MRSDWRKTYHSKGLALLPQSLFVLENFIDQQEAGTATVAIGTNATAIISSSVAVGTNATTVYPRVMFI